MDQFISNKNQTSITASYMPDFSCIGEKCPDNCCTSSWAITIDKDTFYRYKKVNDLQLKDKMTKSLKKFKIDRTAEKFGYIAHEKGVGRCLFQQECGLCQIQSELGEDALSKTCRTFPRRVKKFNNANFLTGMTSCPEITKLCLSAEVELEKIDKPSSFGQNMSIASTTSNCETAILEVTINLLKKSELSPSMQVLLFVQLIEMFQKFNNAPTEIEYLLSAEKVSQKLSEISAMIDPTDAAIFQYNFFEKLILEPNYNVTAIEPIGVLIKNIANSFMYGSVTKAASISIYMNAKANSLANFENRNPRLFTRLLINEILANAELFVHSNRAYKGVLRDITGRLSFTRFLLAGAASSLGEDFSMDDYVKSVYLASRSLEHDAAKTATLEKALTQQDENPIITSALLLV